MRDGIVVVPSYITAIFTDYGDDWNQNKIENINPHKLNAVE